MTRSLMWVGFSHNALTSKKPEIRFRMPEKQTIEPKIVERGVRLDTHKS